ncbi:unnamed protein product [Urochloa decumbens]|uniref:Zinc finger PHD-type domain-containing protein n=1 Tax=Urochloa decumbens TaxID=240449 RepID=A0ABC9B6P8_9POAL
MLFDDDDDGVAPHFNAVDEYYFEDTKYEPVCFSVLPFKFHENDELDDCGYEKKVYLRGVMDKSIDLVYKKVVSWKVVLDSEQPNISVLSSEGNWIKLLNPRKYYKDKIARSILVTVQMLHFVRKPNGDKRQLRGQLWGHLNEVFNELDTNLVADDLRKHHPIIKLFLERDPALMELKIFHRFIRDITAGTKEPKTLGTKVQFTGSDETRATSNDTNRGYDEDDGNDESNYDDSDYEDDGNDDSNYDDIDKSDYHDNSDNSSEDDSRDGDTCKDSGVDLICALCDDGGNIIRPVQEVFKCNNQNCGHFYHPKCVAKLLEPDNSDDDGYCELTKRIMAGMPFTCPMHWCFKCGRMEDITLEEMQFALCRRCPKSYHIKCLPRAISFETKGKNIKRRAWELSGDVIIYCLDHKICKPTGNAKRGHIKFPHMPKIIEVGDLSEKKGKMVGKRKRSIGQCLKKSSKDSLTDNPPLNKDSELDIDICRIPVDTNGSGEENSSEQSRETEESGTNKDISHESNEGNDALGELIIDIHTEVNHTKLKSRAERSMVLGENGNVHESISAQEKETSKGENQLCRSMCDQESRSGKGKVARNECTKSGSGNAVVTPYHVVDNLLENLLLIPHVDKITITDRLHIQPEYVCDKDQEANGENTFEEEPNTSRCNVSPKAMGMYISGDKPRKRINFEENAAEVGKEAHIDEVSPQCPQNHKVDYQDHKFGNSGPNAPQWNDANSASKVSEYKPKKNTEPCRGENLTHHIREISNSPMDRNSQEKETPSNHLPNRQMTYHDEQHPATNQHHVSYPSNCNNYGIRSHVPTAFDPSRWYNPHSHRPEPDITGWNSPHFHRGRAGHFTHGWQGHCPPNFPPTPDSVHNSSNMNNFPMHGGYRVMGFDPAGIYHSLQISNVLYQPRADVNMEGCGTAYGGPNIECETRSNYILASGPRRPAAGSVTDKYAPHLEQTNNRPRG